MANHSRDHGIYLVVVVDELSAEHHVVPPDRVSPGVCGAQVEFPQGLGRGIGIQVKIEVKSKLTKSDSDRALLLGPSRYLPTVPV